MSKRSNTSQISVSQSVKKRCSSFYISSNVASRDDDEDKENVDPSSSRLKESFSSSKRPGFERILKDSKNAKALSLSDLPHPSNLYGKKACTKRNRTFRKKYSMVENYTQQLKRKQSEFNWLQEESFRLESSLEETQQKQQLHHLDHVVPAYSTEQLSLKAKTALQEDSFNQIVPREDATQLKASQVAESLGLAVSRKTSVHLINSQQVTRSPIVNGTPEVVKQVYDKNRIQPVHTGYRLMAKLQQRCLTDTNNRSPCEANRFLTTGEIIRSQPSGDTRDAVNQTNRFFVNINDNSSNSIGLEKETFPYSEDYKENYGYDDDDGFEFFRSQRVQKESNNFYNVSSNTDDASVIELPPDLEHLDSIIECLNHGKIAGSYDRYVEE